MASTPRTSVVIPTRSRPRLLVRALASAFAQGEMLDEAVVVVDGPCPATVEALEAISDPRLTVIERDESGGASAARNLGAAAARNELIAFLDDDDLWMPSKLARQCSSLADISTPFVAGHAAIRRVEGEIEGDPTPSRKDSAGLSIAEFLFCRTEFGQRKGNMLTPSLLTTRSVLAEHPFDVALRVHEDWDWLLRLDRAKVPWFYLDEPLMIWSLRAGDPPMSAGRAWTHEDALAWADDRRDLLGERGYAGFCMTVAVDFAGGSRGRGHLGVLRSALTARPSLPELAQYPVTLLGEERRNTINQFLARGRRKNLAA